MNNLYKKSEYNIPYNISSKYFKSITAGEVKQKYENKWLLYTKDVNEFVLNAPLCYNSLALSSADRDQRGPLTVVTLNYGQEELSEEYNGDGEISWWSYGGGVYTYHIKRWVTNTPQDIKNFIEHCLTEYGYQENEVTVNCNPTAGEPRTMCQATFTPNLEMNQGSDPTTSDGWDDEEEEEKVVQQLQNIQVQTGMTNIELPPTTWVSKTCGLDEVQAEQYISLLQKVQRGELRYFKQGSNGGTTKTSGWYSTDDTNPNALIECQYPEPQYSKAQLDAVEIELASIPTLQIPSIRITINKKVKAKQRASLQGLITNSLGTTNQKTITCGGQSITVPSNQKGIVGNYEFPLTTDGWTLQGTSFDGGSVRMKTSYKTSKKYYQGSMTQSYTAYYRLPVCGESTGTQTL